MIFNTIDGLPFLTRAQVTRLRCHRRLDPLIHRKNRRSPYVPHFYFDSAVYERTMGQKYSGATLRKMHASNGVGRPPRAV